MSLPAHARCVVIGCGIVGNSVAYHLTRLGWRGDEKAANSGTGGERLGNGLRAFREKGPLTLAQRSFRQPAGGF